VLAVGPELGRPLRMAVLRPHESADQPMYALENDAQTFHVAAITGDGRVVSVASVMADPHPRDPHPGDWRVRGMATDPQQRGRGLMREGGATRVWCNARIAARSFYERAGFSVEGEQFEIPEIGPHLLMAKAL
jgi:ribosomal protein S18 acetylase RimI-like enzyme